jgi:hypothetical protein
MRHLLVVLVASITVAGTANAADPVSVSMIQLISTPGDFDGKRIIVMGVPRIEFEGNALYLHREDYEHALTKNALWLTATGDQEAAWKLLEGQYVLVEGTFSAKNTGHFGLFSGAIHNITRFHAWPRHPMPKAGVPPNKSLERTREK